MKKRLDYKPSKEMKERLKELRLEIQRERSHRLYRDALRKNREHFTNWTSGWSEPADEPPYKNRPGGCY